MKIVLYVGKTLINEMRIVTHLVNLIDCPEYFGLDEKNLYDERITIQVKVEKFIEVDKLKTMKEINDELSKEENAYIEKLNPLTQRGMIMKGNEQKIKDVQEAIERLEKNVKL